MHDGDMLRVNSHTTWRVRQLMRRRMRETGLGAVMPIHRRISARNARRPPGVCCGRPRLRSTPRRAELLWLHDKLRVAGSVVLGRGEERVYVRVTVVRRPRSIGTPRSTGEFLSRYLSATWPRKRSL